MTELEAKIELLMGMVASLIEKVAKLEAAKQVDEIWDFFKNKPDQGEEG